MKKKFAMCAGIAVLGLSSVANAQSTPPPTAPPPSTYDMRHPNSAAGNNNNFRNQYESRRVMRFEDQPTAFYAKARKIAQCVVKRAKDKTGKLIGGPLTADPGFSHLSSALTGRYSECYKDDASGLPMLVLNGMIAEEALRYDATALPSFSAAADADAAKAFYAGDGGFTIDNVGRCLAAYSPGLVNQVLSTSAGTPAEAQALATAYAETPACNVRTPPKDIPMMEQRSALATGLYAWTHRG